MIEQLSIEKYLSRSARHYLRHKSEPEFKQKARLRQKKFYAKPEEHTRLLQYNRNYYRSHPELKEKYRAMRQRYYREHRQILRRLQGKNNFQLKVEVLTVYGGDPPKCACCGESNIGFLSIDHIKNDGAKQRRYALGGNGKGKFYYWLKKHGFPKDLDLQVLCANCNMGKAWNHGICPHKATPTT